MPNIKGRGVRVEIAATFNPPVTVTALTNASPGVATSAAHGQANNTVGTFTAVGGMAQLENQAARVKNTAANTFDLQGLNTTLYSAFSGTALFTPVATWLTLAECTSYRFGGGSSEKLNSTRLIDITAQEEIGNLPADTISLGVLSQDTPTAAMLILESAVQSNTAVVVRITLANGAVRVCRAEPGLPGEDVQQGQLGTGTIEMAVKGLVMKLAA